MKMPLVIILWLVSGAFVPAALGVDDTMVTETTTVDTENPVMPSSTETTEHPKPTTTTTEATTTTTTSEEPSSTTTTTTSEKPTPKPTTPAPLPTPFPKNVGHWNLVEKEDNVTCILLTGALQLKFPLVPGTNKTDPLSKVDISIPETASVSGNCSIGNNSQVITLTWSEFSEAKNKSQLTFHFFLNTTSPVHHYVLKGLNGSVSYLVKHDNKTETEDRHFEFKDINAFETEDSKSYHCLAYESFHSDDNVTFELVQLQVQAFHKTNDTHFGASNTCAMDGYVADIVPIAVGASLAGLVIIVLIAYLIGRRRSRARGYQSV